MAKHYFNFRFKYRMVKECKLKDIKKSLKTALSYNLFWSHWMELLELEVGNTLQRWTVWFSDLWVLCLFCGIAHLQFHICLCFSSFDTFSFPFTLSFPFIKSVTGLLVLMETLYTLFLYSLINSLERKSPLKLIFIMGSPRIKVFYGVIPNSRTIHLCWTLLIMDLTLFVLFVLIAKVNFAIIITIFD